MATKKTNYQKVKDTALAFLHIPVEETNFSPIVVMHPIFESGFISAKINGEFTILNILENEENLQKAIEIWTTNFNNANTVEKIYGFIRKSYRLTFLKFVKPYLSEKDFATLLADAWISSENPNQDANVSIKTAISWFKQVNKKYLMSEEEYEYYQSLPETFTVYRGVAVDRNPQGLSWTCNYKTAEWFANRFNTEDKQGYIQYVEVDKSLALAYFNGRDEDEIVLDTTKIKDKIQCM